MEYLHVGIKGKNSRKDKWIEVGKLRELYPHIQIDLKYFFGVPKDSQWGGVIQGIKKCLKIKLFRFARKWIHCVDIILTIPAQLQQAQIEFV